MDVHDPNGLGLWRECRAGLLRETESHRLAHQLRMACREKFVQHGGRVLATLRVNRAVNLHSGAEPGTQLTAQRGRGRS